MRTTAFVLTALLAATPLLTPVSALPLPPLPVDDPGTVTIVQAVPGGTPFVAGAPWCSTTTGPGFAQVVCGPTPGIPRQIVHVSCLWPAVTATALTGRIAAQSACWQPGPIASVSVDASAGPASATAVDQTRGSFPWECLAQFDKLATGIVVCERGADP